jgi:hypothetical protein
MIVKSTGNIKEIKFDIYHLSKIDGIYKVREYEHKFEKRGTILPLDEAKERLNDVEFNSKHDMLNFVSSILYNINGAGALIQLLDSTKNSVIKKITNGEDFQIISSILEIISLFFDVGKVFEDKKKSLFCL